MRDLIHSQWALNDCRLAEQPVVVPGSEGETNAKGQNGRKSKGGDESITGVGKLFVSVLVSAHISRVRVEYSTPVSVPKHVSVLVHP